MSKASSFAAVLFMAIFGSGLAYGAYAASFYGASAWIGACALTIAIVVSSSVKVANQWDKAVVLRLGTFRALKGPGLFFIIPVIDTAPTGSTPA